MIKLTKTATFLAMALTLSGCVIHVDAQSTNVHLQETLSLEASQLTSLHIESGAGDVIINGTESTKEIIVRATIDTTAKRDYELTLQKVGSTAVLVAKHDSTSGFWVGNSPQVNLEITVPHNLALKIDDGSGDLNIYAMHNHVSIEDGSGDIVINNVKKDLEVDDGSGDLRLSNISGDLTINDGSGDVWANDIGGDLIVDDGSGELTLHNIKGVITINDGSGDIEVINAGGLTITDSGSGDLTIEKVQGELNIGS